MSYKPKLVEKIYYTIGEVSSMFDVNTSLIRFWEKEFDIIKPKKNKKGNRLFTKQDVDNLHIIYNLVKEKGYTLQGAKDYLATKTDVITRDIELIKSLTKVKDFLLQLKKQI